MARFKTKPGKHGTLYLHRVHYRDEGNDDNSDVVRLWAYSEEHAWDRFFGAPDAEGWEITKIERVKER